MQVGLGFWASKTLLSAVELGVFSTLADAPADLPTLQRKLALHQRSARDFLDALVALKLLERENGVYNNTADTDLFLDRAKPSYIGGVLEMANARLYGFWGSLTEALRTGEVQNENKGGGENVFAAVYADPDRLRGFLTAMSGISAGAAHAIAANFPWSDQKTFMDLGSAQGMVPATLARAHPHLTGIGFDLPVVKPVFEEFIAHRGVTDRVRFQGGNFFRTLCRKLMSSSWVTSSMIGTLPRKRCFSAGHLTLFRKAAQSSFMMPSSMMIAAKTLSVS